MLFRSIVRYAACSKRCDTRATHVQSVLPALLLGMRSACSRHRLGSMGRDKGPASSKICLPTSTNESLLEDTGGLLLHPRAKQPIGDLSAQQPAALCSCPADVRATDDVICIRRARRALWGWILQCGLLEAGHLRAAVLATVCAVHVAGVYRQVCARGAGLERGQVHHRARRRVHISSADVGSKSERHVVHRMDRRVGGQDQLLLLLGRCHGLGAG